MAKTTPSNLILRNGIYYFHLRTPQKLGLKSRFIRKSTRTGNFKEALQTAYKWKYKLMSRLPLEDTLEIIEHALDRDAQKYRRGKTLYTNLQLLDHKDTIEVDHFFERLTPHDTESLNHYQDSLVPEPAMITDPVKIENKPSNKEDIRLSDVLKRYVAHNMSREVPWRPKSKEKFESQITLMIDMVGNPYAQDLNAESLRDLYGNLIQRIPTSLGNKKRLYFDGKKRKSFEEIIRIAQENSDKVLTSRSISDHVGNVISFLKWAGKKKYIDRHVYEVLEDVSKVSKKSDTNVARYSDAELKSLFESQDYQTGSMQELPHRYWGPLLGIYTGAREGEICSLHLKDIMYDEDIQGWVIDFNENGKRLKNKYSVRVTPVHPDLITLGFIDYVNSLKRINEILLFPGTKPTRHGDEWGRKLSRWFNGYTGAKKRTLGYKERCGIVSTPGDKKNFHSFRHTLIDHAKQNGYDDRVIREIVGHSVGKKDVHAQTYEKSYLLDNRQKVMNAIKFNFDISKIKKWPSH